MNDQLLDAWWDWFYCSMVPGKCPECGEELMVAPGHENVCPECLCCFDVTEETTRVGEMPTRVGK